MGLNLKSKLIKLVFITRMNRVWVADQLWLFHCIVTKRIPPQITHIGSGLIISQIHIFNVEDHTLLWTVDTLWPSISQTRALWQISLLPLLDCGCTSETLPATPPDPSTIVLGPQITNRINTEINLLIITKFTDIHWLLFSDSNYLAFSATVI